MQSGLNNRNQPVPEVGIGATECCWSDRHAFTIVAVISDKEIIVQRDKAIRVDNNGESSDQDYKYEPDTEGQKIVVTRRKNGRWVTQKELTKNGTKWRLGERDEYYDYSF